MKAKEFTELKNQVKINNLKGITEKTIQDLTVKQSMDIEDILLDMELTKEGNQLLDLIVAHIEGTVKLERVANKKAPAPKAKKAQPEQKKEPEPKAEQKKEAPKAEPAPKEAKPAPEPKEPKEVNKIEVGDTVQFQVEGEEVIHDIKVIHIGKHNIIGVMADDEREVFNVRKADFNKKIFAWTDRKNEKYNIIITL